MARREFFRSRRLSAGIFLLPPPPFLLCVVVIVREPGKATHHLESDWMRYRRGRHNNKTGNSSEATAVDLEGGESTGSRVGKKKSIGTPPDPFPSIRIGSLALV